LIEGGARGAIAFLLGVGAGAVLYCAMAGIGLALTAGPVGIALAVALLLTIIGPILIAYVLSLKQFLLYGSSEEVSQKMNCFVGGVSLMLAAAGLAGLLFKSLLTKVADVIAASIGVAINFVPNDTPQSCFAQ
jgi:hypothetical protein